MSQANGDTSRIESIKERYPTEEWPLRFESAVRMIPMTQLRERKAERRENIDA